MDEARVGVLGRTVPATEFEQYPAALRLEYADSLSCPSCQQPAYFIRQARTGRAACFGARPHTDGCPLATTTTDDDPRVADDAIFLLQPMSSNRPHPARGGNDTPQERVQDAARRSSRTSRSTRHPSMGLGALLKRLIRDPTFRDSVATLVLPDNTRGSIAEVCVEATTTDLSHQNRPGLYWGTIRYAHPDDTGAWFNLGRRGAPALRLSTQTVTALLTRHNVDDVDDLQGASFITSTRPRKGKTRDRLYFFIADLEWFALRLAEDDLL
jgi:hypothetical protein